MNLKKNILITGASSSIGRMLIQQLLNKTPHHIIAHLNRGTVAADDINADRLSPISCDFSDPLAVDTFTAEIHHRFEIIDQIVHIAAPKLRFKRFSQMAWEDDFNQELSIQVRSIAKIMKATLPKMVSKTDSVSKIVFVLSSVTMGVPPKNTAHYTMAKMALLGLMKSLASEYGDKRVRFNAISPSMLETDFLTEIPAKLKEISIAAHPLKRLGQVSDIISAIEFLLGPGSDFINGANIPLTGGESF